MRVLRAAVAAVAVAAFAGALSAPAMAETIGVEGQQPLITGRLSGEDIHGVLHCQAVADLVAPGTPAPGVIVVHSTEPVEAQVAAPQEGFCEKVGEALFG